MFLLFDSNNKETCIIGESIKHGTIVNKYRKEEGKNHITFYICEEIFVMDKKSKIDTCKIESLKNIKFETLKTLDDKRAKQVHVFKHSVFEKIFIVEKNKKNIIKYPVLWTTDLIQVN